MGQAVYEGRRTTPWFGVVPLLLLGMAALSTTWFVSLGNQPVFVGLVYLSYLLAVIVLPGTICWRWLTGGTGWFAIDACLGSVLGLALECLIYLAGRWIDVPRLPLVLPILGVLLAVVPFRPGRPEGRLTWPVVTGSVVSLGVLAAWFARAGSHLVPISGPLTLRPNSDSPYQLAVAAELTHHFPPQIPYVAGEPLHYHWMVYNHVASAHWLTRVELDVLLAQIVPLELMLLTVLGVAATAVVLSGRLAAAPIGALLTVLFGDLSLWSVTTDHGLYTDGPLAFTEIISPTQSLGTVLLLPLIAVTALLLRVSAVGARRYGCWTLALVMIGVLSVSKATVMPVYGAGLAAAWLYLLLRYRRFDLTTFGLGVVTAGLYMFQFVVVMQGERHGMVVAPGATFRALLTRLAGQSVPVQGLALWLFAVGLVLSWVLPAVGALLIRRTDRRDPMVVFLLGGLAGAVAGASLTRHYSESQIFFVRPGFVLGVLLAAWGMACLSRRVLLYTVPALVGGALAVVLGRELVTGRPDGCADTRCLEVVVGTPMLLAFAGALVVVLLLGLVSTVTRRRPAGLWLALLVVAGVGMTLSPTIGGIARGEFIPRVGYEAIPRGGIQAARYIRTYSDPDDVIATNIHCRMPRVPPCQNAAFWIPGYAERRVLVQGWAYTSKANAGPNPLFGPFWDPERLERNDVVFRSPTQENLAELWRRHRVRWLFHDSRLGAPPASLVELTAVHVEVGTVHVYKLRPPADADQFPR